MQDLELYAKQDFDNILQLINYSLEIENSDGMVIDNSIFYKSFTELFNNYKELAVKVCYDFCIKPQSRIATCIDIINCISYNKTLTFSTKALFLYNIIINSNWFRVQEASIQCLCHLKSYGLLENLKIKTTDERIRKSIELSIKKATSFNSLLSLLYNKFFK